MTKRTPAEVYATLRAAGWPAPSAMTMTAIAGAESGWDDAAQGDLRLADTTWGPSYGLFQIRTLKRATGTGGTRDITVLAGDDLAQARAAWEISQHGADLSPWTVYRTGAYRRFLDAARAAAGGNPSSGDLSSADLQPAGWGPSWLPWNAAGQAVAGTRHIVIEAAFLGLGLVLVAAGVAAAVRPTLLPKAKARVERNVELAKTAALAVK